MESNYKKLLRKIIVPGKGVGKVSQTHLNNILPTYFTMKNAGAATKI